MTKKIATPGRRAVKEWIGKTPDSEAPATVKERILVRQNWRCAKSGVNLRRTTKKIHFDHITAIINGGENRESNLQAMIEKPHKAKTRTDRAERSKTVKTITAHYGLKKEPKRTIAGGKNSPVKRKVGGGTVERAAESRQGAATLPRVNRLYRDKTPAEIEAEKAANLKK